MRSLTRAHEAFMSKLGTEDPAEKMDYLTQKMQSIRVTGSYQGLKKPC